MANVGQVWRIWTRIWIVGWRRVNDPNYPFAIPLPILFPLVSDQRWHVRVGVIGPDRCIGPQWHKRDVFVCDFFDPLLKSFLSSTDQSVAHIVLRKSLLFVYRVIDMVSGQLPVIE